MSRVLYSRGGLTVTETLLHTRRRAYDLSRIDSVTVRQPLFLFAGVLAVGTLGFAAAFWSYLYPMEKVLLTAVPLGVIALFSQIGTLTLHSFTHRGGDDTGTIIGWFPRLTKAKAAVEQAMQYIPTRPGMS